MGNLFHAPKKYPPLLADDSIQQEHKKLKNAKLRKNQQCLQDQEDHQVIKQWFNNLCLSMIHDTEKWDEIYYNMCQQMCSPNNPKDYIHRVHNIEQWYEPIHVAHPERLISRVIFGDEMLYGKKLICKGNRFHKCYVELIPYCGARNIILLIHPKKF